MDQNRVMGDHVIDIGVEEAYAVLERIVVNGFLTAEIRPAGSYVVLKNMTDRESGMLDLFRDPAKPFEDVCCKLALCTFSVDGQCFMASRAEAIPSLMVFWRDAPVSLVSSAVDAVQGINDRYYDVLRFLEGFCYTSRSRYLWRVYKEGALFSVPGGLAAGMNAVQENWAIVNRELDNEAEYEKDFNLSLMISSSFNAKGAKTIARTYEASRVEAEELRCEIAKWGYDKKRVEEEKRQAEWTAPLRSREDLVRELYRQIRGEKDKHDLFIDKWMEKQRERAELAKNKALERAQQWRAKMQESASLLDDNEDSRRATPEEMEKLSEVPSTFSSKYMSAYERVEQDDRFVRKIGTRVIGK